jgi:hypothetical protein
MALTITEEGSGMNNDILPADKNGLKPVGQQAQDGAVQRSAVPT